MGQGLKQRLLGAGVLVLLLVLLAPSLFRGGESHPLVVTELRPPHKAPEVPAFVEVLDSAPDTVTVETKARRPVEDDKGQPGIDKSGNLKAWSLQLASFSDQSNARKLQTTLRSKGYSAYIRKVIRSSGRPLFRVYIGPEVSTNELNELKSQLETEMGLSGMVVRFEP